MSEEERRDRFHNIVASERLVRSYFVQATNGQYPADLGLFRSLTLVAEMVADLARLVVPPIEIVADDEQGVR